MVHPPLTLAKSPTDLTWPQFRGVRGENRSEGKIPTEFRPGRNELWHVEVPRGNSSPVIWDDHVFSTGADDTNLFVLCITRETGKLKWKREFKIEFDRDYFHTDSSPASPTSCTDGERVYSYFGNYGIVAHDFDGKLIWEKNFPVVGLQFGLGSSDSHVTRSQLRDARKGFPLSAKSPEKACQCSWGVVRDNDTGNKSLAINRSVSEPTDNGAPMMNACSCRFGPILKLL